jgi:phosphoglycolate phosphatase
MLSVLRPLPAQQIRLIVFDLDGTLIDSRKDLCTAVNAMLTEFGRQPLPEEIIATYIGDGAGMLVRRALGDPHDEPLVESALEHFLTYYRAHKLDHTYVYPGVFEALAALKTMPNGGGARSMAVLTNKPIGPTLGICEGLGLKEPFFQIYGGDSFATKKPDATGLCTLIREAGVRPDETLMVGDTDVDMLTAQRAGTWSLGCRYGLSPHTIESIPADVLVDSPAEWVEAFTTAAASR